MDLNAASPSARKIRLTVVGADSLIQRQVFKMPDSFVIATVWSPNGPSFEVQSATVRQEVNPRWMDVLEFIADERSTLTLSVHDTLMRKRERGFLGQATLGLIEDLLADASTKNEATVTRRLEKTANNLAVQGQILFRISGTQVSSRRQTLPATLPASMSFLSSPPPPRRSGVNRRSHSYNTPAVPAPSTSQPLSIPPFRTSQSYPSALSSVDIHPRLSPNPDPHVESPPRNRDIRRQSRASLSPHSPINEVDAPRGRTERSTDPQVRLEPQRLRQRAERTGGDLHRTMTLPEHRRVSERTRGVDAVLETESAPGAELTSSSPPRATVPSVPEEDTRPLPDGWSSRSDPKGRVYFVDRNRRRTTWTDPRGPPTTTLPAESTVSSPSTTSYTGVAQLQLQLDQMTVRADELGELPLGWEARQTPAGRSYWIDHHTKTTTWDDPRLPAVGPVKDQRKLNFRRKLIYFRSQPPQKVQPGECVIEVRRESLFEDAYSEIMQHEPKDLRKRLLIQFKGEEGVDYGGVSREFFFLLSHAIFDPDYCLFEHTSKGNYTLQINPRSSINPEHLLYFRFIGRAVGLAIFHRRFLDAHFAPSIYKLALGKPVGLSDMVFIDADLHQSLTWITENDIDGILDNTFIHEGEIFGELQAVELKPGGSEVQLTDKNKLEYVQLMCEHRLKGQVLEQITAFRRGLNEVIEEESLAIFDEGELELLIGGISDLEVSDWKTHTEYRNYASTDEPVLWFWEVISSWSVEQRARVLQFTTGTSRTPVGGFRDLQGSDGPRKFTIERSFKGGYPQAHTCFNRLDLPPYETKEKLEEMLSTALEQGAGFQIE